MIEPKDLSKSLQDKKVDETVEQLSSKISEAIIYRHSLGYTTASCVITAVADFGNMSGTMQRRVLDQFTSVIKAHGYTITNKEELDKLVGSVSYQSITVAW